MAREDLGDLLGIGSEEKGKIQQVFCYSDGDETGGEGWIWGAEGRVCILCLPT